MANLLEARNIRKTYAAHTALDDVSINIGEQRIFGLLGPNGAGKTSLIRIINQITAPDEGQLLFDGTPLNSTHISQIGYLPEERGLYKKMKVGEQAIYLARLRGMDRKEAMQKLRVWFEKFEIAGWWNKKVEELSKGMAQKIQFIVTVVHEPRLLILDEPFSGFDPINTNLIKQEILNLRDAGATVIFSTHNMGSVEEICDDIALINRSRVILDGTVDDVRNSFSNKTYQIRFKGEIIAFTNALWTAYELITKVKTDDVWDCTIQFVGQQTVNDLLKAIIPHVEVLSLIEVVPSMNDIFISKVTEMGETVEEAAAEGGDA